MDWDKNEIEYILPLNDSCSVYEKVMGEESVRSTPKTHTISLECSYTGEWSDTWEGEGKKEGEKKGWTKKGEIYDFMTSEVSREMFFTSGV